MPFEESEQIYLLLTPLELKLRRRMTSSRERSAISALVWILWGAQHACALRTYGRGEAVRDGERKGTKYTRKRESRADQNSNNTHLNYFQSTYASIVL